MKILDIGANNGTRFALKVIKKYPNVKLICVEANDSLITQLQYIVPQDHIIDIVNKAVSSEDNKLIEFYICDTTELSTANQSFITDSRFAGKHSWRPIQVESITIDSLIKQYGTPDIIKIDVEGYELNVLKGMTDKYCPVCFEWAEESFKDTNECVEYLKSIGYTKFAVEMRDGFDIPINWDIWENLSIHSEINPNNKQLWGMIWAKF